jgi:hypothetical protein
MTLRQLFTDFSFGRILDAPLADVLALGVLVAAVLALVVLILGMIAD